MVESNDRTTEPLENPLSRLGISTNALNFEKDVFKLFLREEYTNFKDDEKIIFILTKAENAINEWYREHYEGRDLMTLDYEK
jgi:hypothetical protein